MSDECPCCRSVSAIGWLERAISALQEELALHAKIEERQYAEIAALRGAIRWLDRHRGELPSLMNPVAYAAYIRALEEHGQ